MKLSIVKELVVYASWLKNTQCFLTGCSPVMCAMFCEFGFATDPVTRCPMCKCFDPCEVSRGYFFGFCRTAWIRNWTFFTAWYCSVSAYLIQVCWIVSSEADARLRAHEASSLHSSSRVLWTLNNVQQSFSSLDVLLDAINHNDTITDWYVFDICGVQTKVLFTWKLV